jgi:hypothetical protein
VRIHLNGKKLGVVAHICHPNDSKKCKTGGSQSRLTWLEAEPHVQSNQIKRAGSVIEMIQCLLSKCKALSSNSSPTKEKNLKAIKNIHIIQILQNFLLITKYTVSALYKVLLSW